MDLMPLISTAIAAFMPVAVQTVKDKFLSGVPKPVDVNEYIALINAESARFEAIAKLDSTGDTYKWVEAVRKLQRPVITFGVVVVFLYLHIIHADTSNIDTVANWVLGFLFGERYLVNASKR